MKTQKEIGTQEVRNHLETCHPTVCKTLDHPHWLELIKGIANQELGKLSHRESAIHNAISRLIREKKELTELRPINCSWHG
jgi:hypothetical protein